MSVAMPACCWACQATEAGMIAGFRPAGCLRLLAECGADGWFEAGQSPRFAGADRRLEWLTAGFGCVQRTQGADTIAAGAMHQCRLTFQAGKQVLQLAGVLAGHIFCTGDGDIVKFHAQ